MGEGPGVGSRRLHPAAVRTLRRGQRNPFTRARTRNSNRPLCYRLPAVVLTPVEAAVRPALLHAMPMCPLGESADISTATATSGLACGTSAARRRERVICNAEEARLSPCGEGRQQQYSC